MKPQIIPLCILALALCFLPGAAGPALPVEAAPRPALATTF